MQRLPTFHALAPVIVMLGLSMPVQADFLLGVPRKLGPEVNSTTRDATPSLSGDGKTLFYSSRRPGGIGTHGLWQVTRETLEAPWESPENISSIGGVYSTSPSVTADGLELYFADGWGCCNVGSPRPDGQGGFDIRVSKRDSIAESWGEPENLGPLANSSRHEDGPAISADGLSLYFVSVQTGGFGRNDIYVATRPGRNDPWEPPENLGPNINSSANEWLGGVSADGLTLFFDSGRPGKFHNAGDIWVATRLSIDEEFGEPVHFSPTVNTSSGSWDMAMSPDGSALYYGIGHGNSVDIWEAPLLPFEAVAITGASGSYMEDFDAALGDDTRAKGSALPTGWSGSDNGVVFESMTTARFPARSSLSTTFFYNAGGEDDVDRALALGVSPNSNQSMLQLLAEVVESDATAFQLQFDIEAWDATRTADIPGEAAFDVTVEADSGDGFVPIVDLETVSTGTVLQLPDGSLLNGNASDNRISFDSGIRNADVPAGSMMRIRWTVPKESAATGWVFGLDNVSLSLFNGGAPGDVNGDGVCDVADINLLTAEVIAGTNDPAFDVNSDGSVNAEDRRVWVEDIKHTYFGDSNLDGQFNTDDLVEVFAAGEYEDGPAENSTWATGDWNGDLEFDTSDLVNAFQAAGFEAGPRTEVAAVPEPSSLILFVIALMAFCRVRCRNQVHSYLSCSRAPDQNLRVGNGTCAPR